MESKFLRILKQRGFIQDCTDFEGLDAHLLEKEKTGEPAVAYIGFDCTAESLHVGSLLQIMALKWFQECGHKPIILLGGGTTKIGDPSGKDESRKMLDDEQIEKNKAGIKKVFEKFITFGNGKNDKANDAIIVDNDEWLGKKGYIEFLREIGTHFTISRMMSMESVKRRIESDSLTFLEFNYMILQSYDFVELAKNYDCRIQIGGSDQWGNIVTGIDLSRRLGSAKNLFGLTTPLLTTAGGAKMGKTADGAVWLDEKFLSPFDYWQFWRNADDADVERFLKYFTTLDLVDTETLGRAEGAEINNSKIRLANEVTSMLHGESAAINAFETAKKVFEQGGIGDDLPVIKVSQADLENGIAAMELFVKAGLAESNGEVKRLVKGGGAKVNDKKLNNHAQEITSKDLESGKIKLSAGKKKHAVIEVT